MHRLSDRTESTCRKRVRQHADELIDMLRNKNADPYIYSATAMVRDIGNVMSKNMLQATKWELGDWNKFREQKRKQEMV